VAERAGGGFAICAKELAEYAMAQPAATPTIRANLLASLVAELLRQGADAEMLLRTHIESDQPIRDPYQEVPLGRYVAFFEAAAETAGDLIFGARLGARFQPEDLGPLGVVFVAAPSLRAALNRLGFFLRAWQGGTSSALEVRSEAAEWTYQIEDPALWPRRQDAEFSLAATCSLIRTLLGPGWAPMEVQFEHLSPTGLGPRERRALAALFQAPVLYGHGVNRIVFDPRDLDRPVSNPRQAIAPYLERHLRDLMGSGGGARRLADQAGHLIARRIGRGAIDLKSLAAELGLSARTLQRRLAEEGTSLRDLTRAHRLRLAEPALAGGSMPVNVIASDLGYADVAGFSRAFRRWRGRGPRAWRQDAAG
jgi:AraC-like DNA-binding protein